jgi:hypothetical protein
MTGGGRIQKFPAGGVRQFCKLFRMNRLVPFQAEFLERTEALLKEPEQLRLLLAERK